MSKDVICCKCNYVLDLDEYPDDGECPKCQGTMYEEGEAFDPLVTPIQNHFLDLFAEVSSKNPKKLKN